MVAFIDVEHALDPQYARACGVDVDNLLVSQPDTGEQALEITETLIRSGGVDCVVVDSVAALVPRAEIEGEMGDSFVGIQARLMSQALRKLTGIVSRSNTALVFTNQLREKIGVMFGNPETTPGGRALKFYSSVRLDIRRIETITTGSEAIGIRCRVKVVKNKVAAPFRVAEFDVMYGSGISREGGLLDVGVALEVVRKTGAWFNYGETRLGQGREQSKEFLRTNPDIAQRLETEIRARWPPSTSPWRASKRPSRPRPPGGTVRGRDAGRDDAATSRGERRQAAIDRRARRAEVTDADVVMDAAAAFLAVRPRSVAETRRRLRTLGYPEALVAQVVDRLVAIGYLDDPAFARAWVESRDRARPRGSLALRQELAQKGVARDVVDDILAERAETAGDRQVVPGVTAVAHEAAVEDEAADGCSVARAPCWRGSLTRDGVARRPTRCWRATASRRTSVGGLRRASRSRLRTSPRRMRTGRTGPFDAPSESRVGLATRPTDGRATRRDAFMVPPPAGSSERGPARRESRTPAT